MSYAEKIETYETFTDVPPGQLKEAGSETIESALAPWGSFLLKMESCESIPARAQVAINHAEFLNWQFAQERTSNPMSVEDVLPSLLSSAVSYHSHRHLLDHYYPLRLNKRATKSSRSKVKDLVVERNRLHENIAIYDELMSSEDEDVAYQGLLSVFIDAQRIIRGTDKLSFEELVDSKHELAGFLAELQVVKALRQNGMHETRRGTPAEDMKKVDVVVPAPGVGDKVVNIQVKSGSRDSVGMTVNTCHPGLEVRVPINTSHNGAMNMKPRYSKRLNLAVKALLQPS